jgi:Tfp pilus assembly protein PilF
MTTSEDTMQSGRHSAGKGLASPRPCHPSAVPVSLALALGIVFAPAACSASPNASPDAAQRSIGEYDLAREAFQRGKLREALDHVQKSLDLDEENGDAAYLGAITLLAFCAAVEDPKASTDCRLEDAERYARQALEVSPEMRDAKNTLGVILVHQGRYDEAVEVLKPLANDILYASPENAWGNLGWAYLLRGNIDEAIDALRRSVAAQPLFCVGQYRLGLAYEKKGEPALAREALTKALETQRPDCQRLQDAFDARARVAMKLGQTEEARSDLLRCRDIGASTKVGQRCSAQLRGLQ